MLIVDMQLGKIANFAFMRVNLIPINFPSPFFTVQEKHSNRGNEYITSMYFIVVMATIVTEAPNVKPSPRER
jgi:hypothetical protein